MPAERVKEFVLQQRAAAIVLQKKRLKGRKLNKENIIVPDCNWNYPQKNLGKNKGLQNSAQAVTFSVVASSVIHKPCLERKEFDSTGRSSVYCSNTTRSHP